jgi:hypothetical protein
LGKFLEAYKERVKEMSLNILKINSYMPELYYGPKVESKNSKEARELAFRFVEERCKKRR